jgi:hypothetical protein
MNTNVMVLGEALMDCVAQPDGRLLPLLGGSPYNMARAAARRGASVAYLNPLSTDRFGEQLGALLREDGVRTLGASSRQMFFSVTLPGAVPVLFSGLRLGVIYALLGVVGAEVIASERGLGQQLAYLGSTFNVNGVWSLLFDLALIGVLIMKLMNWIERRLLHWQ